MLARLQTARNRELVNLLFLAVLTVAGFTAVLVARSGASRRRRSSTRRVFLGALRGRAHRAADPAPAGRSLPASARRHPRLARALRDLPHPPGARARPGALDGDRRRGVRRRAGAAARFPRARALPLPERCARARPAGRHHRLVVRDAHRDQRRARLDPRGRSLVPAGRAGQDLPRALPRRATCASGASCWRRRRRACSASACRRSGSSRRCSACSGPPCCCSSR